MTGPDRFSTRILRPRLHRYGSLVDAYHKWCGLVASTLLCITFAAGRLTVYTSTDSKRNRGLYIANEARNLRAREKLILLLSENGRNQQF